MSNQISGDRELGPDEAVVVIYASASREGIDRTAPFGLKLQRESQ